MLCAFCLCSDIYFCSSPQVVCWWLEGLHFCEVHHSVFSSTDESFKDEMCLLLLWVGSLVALHALCSTIYIYIYMYIYIYIYIYIFINIIYMYTYIYIYLSIYCFYLYMYSYLSVYLSIYKYRYRYIHRYIDTDISICPSQSFLIHIWKWFSMQNVFFWVNYHVEIEWFVVLHNKPIINRTHKISFPK